MHLPQIIKRLFRIEPKTDTSGIRTFRSEEFRAFCLAGKEHEVMASRIYDDFRCYLRELRVPRYVSETVRKNRASRRRRH